MWFKPPITVEYKTLQFLVKLLFITQLLLIKAKLSTLLLKNCHAAVVTNSCFPVSGYNFLRLADFYRFFPPVWAASLWGGGGGVVANSVPKEVHNTD